MRQKLNLITLGVEDLQRSLAFYEGLGWKKSKRSGDDFALFPLGGMVLALYPRSALAADAGLTAERPAFSGISVSYNARSEREVDEILQNVGLLGAEVIRGGETVFWGGYRGYFKDPDGFLFEVVCNPFWLLDENDNLVL